MSCAAPCGKPCGFCRGMAVPTEWQTIKDELQDLGFEPGWGRNVRTIRETHGDTA